MNSTVKVLSVLILCLVLTGVAFYTGYKYRVYKEPAAPAYFYKFKTPSVQDYQSQLD